MSNNKVANKRRHVIREQRIRAEQSRQAQAERKRHERKLERAAKVEERRAEREARYNQMEQDIALDSSEDNNA